MMLGLALALAAAACPIDRTVYRLREDARFTAGFARTLHPTDMASDLRFFLRTPRRTFWFSFAVSQGHSSIAIVPSDDPHRDTSEDAEPPPRDEPPAIAFAAFDRTLRIRADVPRGGEPAPAYLFAADLDQKLWYEPVALADGDTAAVPEEMPEGMFAATGCAARPH